MSVTGYFRDCFRFRSSTRQTIPVSHTFDGYQEGYNDAEGGGGAEVVAKSNKVGKKVTAGDAVSVLKMKRVIMSEIRKDVNNEIKNDVKLEIKNDIKSE